MDYECLTKIIKNAENEEYVACAFYGTEMCQIHNCDICSNCPVYAMILNQLHEFEQIYINALKEE